MILDSPYNSRDLVFKPWAGFLIGTAAAGLMLAVVSALAPATGLTVQTVLREIGSVVVSVSSSAGEGTVVGAGIALHLAVGALLGALYTASQQRAPVRGLIAVGVFYGIVIWIIGGLVIRWFVSASVGGIVHSLPWFVACLVFGLSHAAIAIVAARRRTSGTAVVPVD